MKNFSRFQIKNYMTNIIFNSTRSPNETMPVEIRTAVPATIRKQASHRASALRQYDNLIGEVQHSGQRESETFIASCWFCSFRRLAPSANWPRTTRFT
jgi:hypothetical protein